MQSYAGALAQVYGRQLIAFLFKRTEREIELEPESVTEIRWKMPNQATMYKILCLADVQYKRK